MNITKLKVERLILAHEEAINSLEYIARAHPTATGSWQREDALKHAKESVEILRGLAEDAEPETAMIDAAMLAMKGICPPLRRSECRQLIRAAFNATSPQAPKDAEPVLLTKFNVTGAVPAVITPTVTFATTSPQAAQTALKSESSAQAAQALAQPPSEGKTIEALAPTEAALRDVVRQSEDLGLYDADFQIGAQEREDFEAHWYNFYHAGHISADVDGKYRSSDVQKSWNAWKARAGRKG